MWEVILESESIVSREIGDDNCNQHVTNESPFTPKLLHEYTLLKVISTNQAFKGPKAVQIYRYADASRLSCILDLSCSTPGFHFVTDPT